MTKPSQGSVARKAAMCIVGPWWLLRRPRNRTGWPTEPVSVTAILELRPGSGVAGKQEVSGNAAGLLRSLVTSLINPPT
jgi:hypothetical protein